MHCSNSAAVLAECTQARKVSKHSRTSFLCYVVDLLLHRGVVDHNWLCHKVKYLCSMKITSCSTSAMAVHIKQQMHAAIYYISMR
mmetsp:Transcript_3629/g.8956  ORF Transcript_3629/g.8956 Transcript_3629/m.8956 type:complete len:85 (-) Transcript_3629:119-373(-)